MRTLTLACVVIALALSACASDNDTSTAAEATTTTTAAEPTTSTAEPVTTTTVAETTTTAAEDTATTTTLPRLPLKGVAEPGTYSARWGGVGTYAIDSVPISVALTSPMSTTPYGLSDCCGTFPEWGRAFWPEPIPAWMEPFVEWNEDDDRVELVAPLVAVYRLTHLYPSGDADGKVAVADVDDLAAILADHPALVESTQPAAVTIGGYKGVRVESAFSGTLGECGEREDSGVWIRCLIGLDWEGSSEADWRFRTDIVSVGDKVVLLQTRLYPDAEEESKAMADAIIEGIEFPTA